MHIELKGIRKYFGAVKANDGISLSLDEGKIYGLLGENGAGKSTLMKILSGYQPPDSGVILLNGVQTDFKSPADALAKKVGMLYQDPLDFPPFSILDNFLLGKDRRFIPNYKATSKELREISSRYGFEVDVKASIDSLSVGERQQLELVRLLVGGAEFLILDEPTTGISGEQKELLFNSMHTLARDEGKTLILVSHKLDEVQELCDEAFVLQKGKLVGGTEIPCPNEKLVEMMFGQVPERSERVPFDLGKNRLEFKDVTITTYRLTVENINFELKAGEVFGLAGLEGSGQQLVMHTCAGLLHPSLGEVILDGQDVSNRSYQQMKSQGVGYVSAGRLEEGLVAGLTLSEHVVLSFPEHEFLVNWERARTETVSRIEKYQIVGTPESQAEELSGGNQQRLLFALLNTPLKLLLLEQPTRGLDVRSSDWIWELLYKRREDGTAIIFISADLDEIIERSDRIAVFSGGKMSRIVEASKTSAEELGYLIGGQL